MTANIPAPALSQGADESLLLQIGDIVYPGFVQRTPGQNGLRLVLPGAPGDDGVLEVAGERFQILLGILRALRPSGGQRADEVRPGIGSGPMRDEHGNQTIRIGPAVMYIMAGGELAGHAQAARTALGRSTYIVNALFLHGRRDRNAADLYMIEEYAEMEFGNRATVAAELKVPRKDLEQLRRSANNLAPAEGGRHAKQAHVPEWDLERQRAFTATLLKAWMDHLGRKPEPSCAAPATRA